MTAPTPTPSGSTPNCSQYAIWQNGTEIDSEKPDYVNSCGFVAYYYSITVGNLLTWNPALSSPSGNMSKCSLQPGSKYCVSGPSGKLPCCRVPHSVSFLLIASPPANTPPPSMNMTSTSTTTTSGTGAPSPTQTGLISSCNKYHQIVAGDGCYDIAATYSIPLNDFYSWNPAVGNDCSSLWSGYYVCVGTSTPTPSATPQV